MKRRLRHPVKAWRAWRARRKPAFTKAELAQAREVSDGRGTCGYPECMCPAPCPAFADQLS